MAEPSSAADTTGAPPRPSDEAELGFRRRHMVRWFDPHQLVDTAKRVVVSGVFGSYADRRELQGLWPTVDADWSEQADVWFDYVADTGDGWNSAYTVARLLAAPGLDLEWDGETIATERGQVLVMGGDQVYPVPTRVEYEDRFLGPYRSALPWSDDDGPDLFAIPGSHDWYDGLVNFASTFCREHHIGGWKTRQRRSYFALQFPHGWWLWAIDVQFGAFLDEAQLGYFEQVARDRVEAGDRVILCMANEVDSGPDGTEVSSDRTVDRLEREVIEAAGARVVLYLKSGLHCYTHYEEEDGPRHRVRAGGGGAFMHPTHHQPEYITEAGAQGPSRYRLKTVYPAVDVSRRLRKWVWVLPFFNLPLAFTWGVVQAAVALLLGLHIGDSHVGIGTGDLWHRTWASPQLFLLLLFGVGLVAALVSFARSAPNLVVRGVVGTLYSAAQIVVSAAAIMAASRLVGGTGVGSTVAFFAVLVVTGGLASTFALSGYLWLANHFGMHDNEAFAPLHHQNYKNFLRLHIDGDGCLTMYPVGIDRVGKRWRLAPDAPASSPWFEPDGEEPRAHLIEEPLVIKP
ncbi:MAG: hypothetical protein ACT4PW_14430 [Acidimicrobiia bacterium]